MAAYPSSRRHGRNVKRLRKGLAWFIAASMALRLIGVLLARGFETGDAESDEVRLAAIWGGRNFRSRATGLRSLAARAYLGGINIDLTGATLHPEGAVVDLDLRLGGVNVEVLPTWRVDVDDRLSAGGVAVDLPEAPPEEAPSLQLRIRGIAGGVNVEADR